MERTLGVECDYQLTTQVASATLLQPQPQQETKQQKNDPRLRVVLVGLPGFEPRMTGPESVVLPLHHSPMFLFDGAKVEQYFGFAKKIAKKIQKKFISLLRFLLLKELKYIKHTDYEKH